MEVFETIMKNTIFKIAALVVMFALNLPSAAFCQGNAPALTAASTRNGVELKWRPPIGMVKIYYVYRRVEGEGNYKKIGYVTDGTSYLDTEAESGKTYCYKVVPTDENKKDMTPSNEVAAAGKVRGAAKTQKRPETPADDESAQEPARKPAPKPKPRPEPENEPESEPGSAAEPAGRKEPAAEPAAPKEKFDASKPAVPDNFRAEWNGGEIALSWNEVAGADGYIVYRSITTPEPGQFLMVSRVKKHTRHSDRQVKPGRKYYYFLIAYKESPKKDAIRSDQTEIITVETR